MRVLPASPARDRPTWLRGTKDVGNNAAKRERRAQVDRYIAAHRNEPHSRWKRWAARGRA